MVRLEVSVRLKLLLDSAEPIVEFLELFLREGNHALQAMLVLMVVEVDQGGVETLPEGIIFWPHRLEIEEPRLLKRIDAADNLQILD